MFPAKERTAESSDSGRTVSGMRIFITGASGFIGSHLTKTLTSHELVTVTRRPLEPQDGLMNIVTELTDDASLLAAMEGCDAVVHLAAMSSATAGAVDPVECVETNVVATARLAQLAKISGVGRFVFASTGLVYGQPTVLPITEQTALDAVGTYSASKLAAESMLRVIHPATAMVRLFNVYGPGQTGTLVPVLIEKLRQGDQVVLQGDGSQVRSFLYVADAVEALCSLVDSDITGVLNLAGERATVLEVYAAIATALGSSASPEFSPGRPGDPKENWAVSERFAKELKWSPRTSLRDGIAMTVAHASDPSIRHH